MNSINSYDEAIEAKDLMRYHEYDSFILLKDSAVNQFLIDTIYLCI